eukprot:31176-Pelagococcus_subviridis.AAC.71
MTLPHRNFRSTFLVPSGAATTSIGRTRPTWTPDARRDERNASGICVIASMASLRCEYTASCSCLPRYPGCPCSFASFVRASTPSPSNGVRCASPSSSSATREDVDAGRLLAMDSSSAVDTTRAHPSTPPRRSSDPATASARIEQWRDASSAGEELQPNLRAESFRSARQADDDANDMICCIHRQRRDYAIIQ